MPAVCYAVVICTTPQPSGPAPTPRDSHSVCAWGRKLVVFGGEDSNNAYLNDVATLLCPPSAKSQDGGVVDGGNDQGGFDGSGDLSQPLAVGEAAKRQGEGGRDTGGHGEPLGGSAQSSSQRFASR